MNFPCPQCGAALLFDPETQRLKCSHCGAGQPIAPALRSIVAELDYQRHLAQSAADADTTDLPTRHCNTCGAESTVPENTVAASCPFCATPFVLQAQTRRVLKPQALLPFKITQKQARDLFRAWTASLWLAPRALRNLATLDTSLSGVYLPHWTYDSDTTTDYQGQRGDYYYENVTVRRTENGRQVTTTERVRRTAWRPASGKVRRSFDDLIVLASESLPRVLADRLAPWDLENLVPAQDEYLSGFRAESYRVSLEQGFALAEKAMRPQIETDIRRDIGGDEQRVGAYTIHHRDITFKHLLLPIWISSYRYGGKSYQFLINARTGEVQGQYPWSKIKIALLVLLALIIITLILLWLSQSS